MLKKTLGGELSPVSLDIGLSFTSTSIILWGGKENVLHLLTVASGVTSYDKR